MDLCRYRSMERASWTRHVASPKDVIPLCSLPVCAEVLRGTRLHVTRTCIKVQTGNRQLDWCTILIKKTVEFWYINAGVGLCFEKDFRYVLSEEEGKVRVHFALRPQKRDGLLRTGTGGGGGGGRGGGGGSSEGSTADTAPKRPERPCTAARTMEVLRRCPFAIAQRLVHCAFAVSTAVLGRVTKKRRRRTLI